MWTVRCDDEWYVLGVWIGRVYVFVDVIGVDRWVSGFRRGASEL